MTKTASKNTARSQVKSAKKFNHSKSISRSAKLTDPKIDALLQKYELPKTIFYHATESQILKLLKHQALHHRLLSDSHSPMKQFGDNRLNRATEKRRRLNQTELKRKWTDNIGVPLSVKSTLSNSEMIEFIFRLYRDQANLAKIKSGHSQYCHRSQTKLKSRSKAASFSQKTKHEQFRETSKRTKKRRLMAYNTLRKVVFETYASGTKTKGTRNYLVPQAPQTAEKPKRKSIRRRALKSKKNKSEKPMFSNDLKYEMAKLNEKKSLTKKKRSEIRMVQSARKHKPRGMRDDKSTKTRRDGSCTTRSLKKTALKRSNSVASDSASIVDKILSIAHTKEASQKYGNTVPAFRTAFVQEMYQYSKQRLQVDQEEQQEVDELSAILQSKQFAPERPEFRCPVGSAEIFSGRRASAFSEFGKKESAFEESNFIKRQAYDKLVKRNVKVKTQKRTNNKLAKTLKQPHKSETCTTPEKVPQLQLEDVKSSE